ncbi:hypothetical protein TNCV_3785081 [Trichonephila clavipes]|nr:hypothetical protein TNCV_3785081 [Trichonephila clavipes]
MRCSATIQRFAAIPDDAIVSAILFCDRMVAKISERRKVLPVPPGASMKNSPPLCSVIAHNSAIRKALF